MQHGCLESLFVTVTANEVISEMCAAVLVRCSLVRGGKLI